MSKLTVVVDGRGLEQPDVYLSAADLRLNRGSIRTLDQSAAITALTDATAQQQKGG